jgi:hypothetical protein
MTILCRPAGGVLLILLVLFAAALAHAQSPRTKVVVGQLLPGEGGPADGPASPLKSPFGIAFDERQTMFIVELEGGRAHRRTADGRLTTIAGNGASGYAGDGQPASQAVFNGMHNVAVTSAGDVYIADTWNHCVRKIDRRTGKIETIAGTGQAGFSGDGGPAKQATFDYVMCVTLDSTQTHLYVADLNNRRIRRIELPSGQVTTVAGNGQRGVPQDGAIAVESPLVDPRAVTVDEQQRIFVLERSGHALRRVDRDGRIHTIAGSGEKGSQDGPARQAQLNSPKHLCLGPGDTIYIADEGNHLIRRYDPRDGGTLATVLGGGRGEPPIELLRPHGVCFHDGRLLVVDTGHDRILEIAP